MEGGLVMHTVARAGAALAALGLFLALATPVAVATVTGGCTVTGTSPAGSIDLTIAGEWHLRSTDVVGGSGTAPSPQKAATVFAYSLGLPLPVVSGQSEDDEGDTEGSASGIVVSTYAVLGHRFVVAGVSDSCSGQVIIVLDDVNPLLTILGGGGLALAILGLLVVLWTARRGSGCGMTLIGGVAGALAGLGLALLLEQLGVIDPTTFIGLALVVLGALLGLFLGGRFGPHAMEVA